MSDPVASLVPFKSTFLIGLNRAQKFNPLTNGFLGAPNALCDTNAVNAPSPHFIKFPIPTNLTIGLYLTAQFLIHANLKCGPLPLGSDSFAPTPAHDLHLDTSPERDIVKDAVPD